ncbi:F-box/WD repeat-containing protein 12 [Aplochiton taeniatus]
MEHDYHYLTTDCLIHIFSFFHHDDLINSSSVCKEWNEVADTPWLWRELCLQRWGFCNITVVGSDHGKQQWKSYFLRRYHLELKMSQGRSGADYTCKSLRGHTGRVVGFVYLKGNSPQSSDFLSSSSILCSASTDGTLRAWDIQKGEPLWVSPVQSPLTGIISAAEHGAVITSDSAGLIKSWNGQTGQEMASYSSAFSQCTLLHYTVDDSAFLSVGNMQGSVHTLAAPFLSKLSNLVVCDSFKVDILLVSPDRKWVLAGTNENNDLSPKVICTKSLTSPSEVEDPLCQGLPIPGCQAAVFLPSYPARLATVSSRDLLSNDKVLTVFDISIKKTRYKSEIQVQQVESFQMALQNRASKVIMEARGGSALVVALDSSLMIYSLKGSLLASFKDHTEAITSICVDSFRVVTASRDLSLRVQTWRTDREKGITLESRYHLLGGSHSMSRGFTNVACDYSSIVASVEATNGHDVLKAYSFNS